MQVDMHYYGTYALARLTGFTPQQANIVATAAQFVDNAVDANPVNLGGQAYLLPVVSAHEMLEIDKNFNRMDQWRVWVPFHFLPGGQGNTADDRLICLWGEPGNHAADAVIKLGLHAGVTKNPQALHLLGIITHVIQDTYAHYGFSGIAHEHNLVNQESLSPLNANRLQYYIADKLDIFFERVAASFAEASRLGHAGAATFPDRPYLRWSLSHEEPARLNEEALALPRDNPATFFRACTRIHAIFHAFLNGESTLPADGHRPFSPAARKEIQSILAEEGTKEERCQRWKHGIESGLLFQPEIEDLELQYSMVGWNMKAMDNNPLAVDTQAYKFNRAARQYLKAINGDILPAMGLLLH